MAERTNGTGTAESVSQFAKRSQVVNQEMTSTMLNDHPPGADIQGACQARTRGRPLRAFTLIELLVVIAIIGILAALVLGAGNVATKWKKRSRVQAELAQLVTALDSFHKKHGNYPPGNSTNFAMNPLFYELTGVIYDPSTSSFKTVDNSSSFTAAGVRSMFNQDGFMNAQENPKDLKPFLELKSADQKKEVSPGVFLLAVPVGGNPANELVGVGGIKINPWRYDATSATRHNPRSYDLWAEVQIGDVTEIIGNWNSNK